MNLIKFDLQGPAEWRGGIAVGADNFILSKELPVECGINRVILRSQPHAGKIVLNAVSDGRHVVQKWRADFLWVRILDTAAVVASEPAGILWAG